MALHGEIKVNGQEIGKWSATRVEDGPDGWNRYSCDVEWTPAGFVRWNGDSEYPINGHHAQRHTFSILHRYADGAVTLAAKVLAGCVASRVSHPDDSRG